MIVVKRIPETVRESLIKALRYLYPPALIIPLLFGITNAGWLSAQIVLIVGVLITIIAAIIAVGPLKVDSRAYEIDRLRSIALPISVALYFTLTLAEDAPVAWALWPIYAICAVVLVELVRSKSVSPEGELEQGEQIS